MGKTKVSKYLIDDHAEVHITGGSDEIDGDILDIDWNPSNYTPDTSPPQVTDPDELTAHLKGIDDAILGSSGGAPVSSVVAFAKNSPPSGWLECDGSAISRATYSALFAIIGTMYGVGDGSTTFNIPDYRGEVLRGYDHGAGNDPNAGSRTNRGDGTTGDNVGTKQADELKSHNHDNYGGQAVYYTSPNVRRRGDTFTDTQSVGGNESRPRNVYTMYIIKY